MKYLILPYLLIFCLTSYAQDVDTSIVNYNGNKFYHLKVDTNTNILIFLHGGVNNPKFQDTSQVQKLNFLLEDNNLMISSALANGFNLLIPITNDSLNWLTNHNYCFKSISSYIDTFRKYSKKYISGFSDGGTGSYKIFYDNIQYFDGLAVFNGYPQHQNFYLNVNYKNTIDKKILFFSTLQDNVIPYEFLLTEYSKQKVYNTNTFLYIKTGAHTFADYDQKAINTCFNILTSKIKNSNNEAVHGFLESDKLIELYVFRKMIVKRYNYGIDFYEENRKQRKKYNKK
jgi:hypothetical protein